LVGFALASGCVVKSGDGDGDSAAGEGGESATGGSSTGGKGGSSTGGKGGSTGGSTTGGSSTGGSTTGGSATGGSSGTVNMPDPECDPDMGLLDSTPFPDCEPRPGDDCDLCVQENCCEESRICYGYDAENVCGWGGPTSGPYAGQSEYDCYVSCASDYVQENGVYDDGAIDQCVGECATDMCGLIGNATQELIGCIDMNCESRCYGT